MTIVFRGLTRRVKWHEFIREDLSSVPLDGTKANPRIKDSDGDIVITSRARNVSLNGDYMIRVRLSKTEIANLAKIALGDERFRDVIRALSATE